MKSFKQQCIELRKKDYTLNEIMKITGRSKTSVYFHIKDIELSVKKQQLIKENTATQARKVAASRKGKGLQPHKTFLQWNPGLVLLVAHLLFDGEIQNAKCNYHNRSESLIKRFERLMKRVYNYPPKKYFDDKSGVTAVCYHNVSLGMYLYQKSKELLAEIGNHPAAHQREFVRAFFDDEGCMDVRLNRNLRRIRGYQNNKKILKLIQKLLKNFTIDSKLQGKNEVVITGKENLTRFQKEINFSAGVQINPNRTNSIWKKNLEKRVLLDTAIKSYKK